MYRIRFIYFLLFMIGQPIINSCSLHPVSTIVEQESDNHRTPQCFLQSPSQTPLMEERTDVRCPSSPYTIRIRSCKTISQTTHPSPLCHLQSFAAHRDAHITLFRLCALWYKDLSFPPEHISFPFSAFW